MFVQNACETTRRALHYSPGADQKLMVEPAVKVDAGDHWDEHGGHHRDDRKQAMI
jgi:hypothetical protein